MRERERKGVGEESAPRGCESNVEVAVVLLFAGDANTFHFGDVLRARACRRGGKWEEQRLISRRLNRGDVWCTRHARPEAVIEFTPRRIRYSWKTFRARAADDWRRTPAHPGESDAACNSQKRVQSSFRRITFQRRCPCRYILYIDTDRYEGRERGGIFLGVSHRESAKVSILLSSTRRRRENTCLELSGNVPGSCLELTPWNTPACACAGLCNK